MSNPHPNVAAAPIRPGDSWLGTSSSCAGGSAAAAAIALKVHRTEHVAHGLLFSGTFSSFSHDRTVRYHVAGELDSRSGRVALRAGDWLSASHRAFSRCDAVAYVHGGDVMSGRLACRDGACPEGRGLFSIAHNRLRVRVSGAGAPGVNGWYWPSSRTPEDAGAPSYERLCARDDEACETYVLERRSTGLWAISHVPGGGAVYVAIGAAVVPPSQGWMTARAEDDTALLPAPMVVVQPGLLLVGPGTVVDSAAATTAEIDAAPPPPAVAVGRRGGSRQGGADSAALDFGWAELVLLGAVLWACTCGMIYRLRGSRPRKTKRREDRAQPHQPPPPPPAEDDNPIVWGEYLENARRVYQL